MTTIQQAKAIIGFVESEFALEPGELTGSRRYRTRPARKAAYYLLRKYTQLSYPEIAILLKCHHTSVLKGERTVDAGRMVELERRLGVLS